MTCPCSRSRFRAIRQLCSLVCLLLGCCSLPQVTPSPNGKIIAVQLFTSSFVDESGPSQDTTMTLFLDDSGREIHPGKGDSAVKDAESAAWLKDNSTVVYLTEVQKPRALFSFQYLNLSTGPAGKAFEGRTFIASDPIRGTNSAIAIERNKDFSGPPR